MFLLARSTRYAICWKPSLQLRIQRIAFIRTSEELTYVVNSVGTTRSVGTMRGMGSNAIKPRTSMGKESTGDAQETTTCAKCGRSR